MITSSAAAAARLLTAARPDDPVGGGDAHRAAQQELRKAKYHAGDRSFLARIASWIGRHLHLPGSGADTFSQIATSAGTAILLAIIVFAIVRYGLPAIRHRGTAADDDPLATAGSAAQHRRTAANLDAQGEYRLALREWLRAAIATIEERGILAAQPGRTGVATAREAGPLLPHAAADLGSAAGAFDEVWFGHRPAVAADSALARRAADAVATARIGEAAASAGGYAVPR